MPERENPMSKLNENYFKPGLSEDAPRTIGAVLSEGEQILWEGAPKKSAFILNRILKMMPFALIWLAFDGAFIAMLSRFGSKIPTPFLIGIGVFFVIHLMPVWIWISHIVTANRQHRNLAYAFTDRRIIVKSGIVGIDFKNVYYADIAAVNLKVGLIDRLCKVGDIYIKSRESATVLYDIENCYFITQKLQKIVVDLKMDAAFPNDLRPATNSGFRTRYTADDDSSSQNNQNK